MKIPRLTARDDNGLTARDDNGLTARDDNGLTARDDNQPQRCLTGRCRGPH